MPEVKPEDLYSKAENERERLRLRTAVVSDYGGHVRVAARRLVGPAHVDDAYQAGMVGLLDALERYEPGRNGPDRGAAFWAYAALYVRNAIQLFKRNGIDWAPAPDRGKGERAEKRAAANERLKAARRFESTDAPDISHDGKLAADFPVGFGRNRFEGVEDLNPEDLSSEAERQLAVSEWAAQLDPADRDLIYSEDGRQSKSRHYLELVDKARAHVNAPPKSRGKDGPGRAVHGNSDTLRP